MSMLGNLLSGSSALVDGAKLVLIGGTIETARRVGQTAWTSFLNSFYLTAHFSDEDYPYDWLHYWLQRQPQWRSSREFETTTKTTTVGLASSSKNGAGGDEDENEWDEDSSLSLEDDALTPGKQKMSVVFKPTYDTTIGLMYRNHWLRITRWQKNGTEMLSISVIARNNTVLKQLVLEAKRMYEADAEHRVNIYFADSHGSWRWTDSRTKRPMSSIVLEKNVKEMLLDDARDFLKSEKWYATRGIPFRRGYLLYGVPGSGKTSLIHAMAGALALDIYVVSLSASWINDATLSGLMQRVPARCIVLLEDLDAAFTRSSSRDTDDTGIPGGKDNGTGSRKNDRDPEEEERNLRSFGARRGAFTPDYNSLSLSGLLNALDGISAPEGRLLFATTNHLERLDPALTRPGRMDVWIEFKNASSWQAEQLFANFFTEVDEEGNNLDLNVTSEPAPSGSSASSFVPRHGPSPSTSGAEVMAAAKEAEKVSDGSEIASPSSEVLPSPASFFSRSPPLSNERIKELAKRFASAIPDGEHSVAALQGYLLRNKSRPEAAVDEAAGWVQSERDLRVRLKKEREERETQLAEEREKRRKDLLEQKRRSERDELKRRREEALRIRKEDDDLAAEEKRYAEEVAKKKAAAEEEEKKRKEGGETKSTTPPDSNAGSDVEGSVVLVAPSSTAAAEVPPPITVIAPVPAPSGA